MLAPKKLKHRKPHRPDVRGQATAGSSIAFGAYALQATTGGWVSSAQIEAARRVITRYVKRGGKIWIRIFPHRAITNKGSQTTMGGGKGAPDHYVAIVKASAVLFEMEGVSAVQAKEAMELAGYKLPVKTKFIAKH